MWGKIIIPMYRLWLNGLYGLYGPRCPPSSKRPINLISLSLSGPQWVNMISHNIWLVQVLPGKRETNCYLNQWWPISMTPHMASLSHSKVINASAIYSIIYRIVIFVLLYVQFLCLFVCSLFIFQIEDLRLSLTRQEKESSRREDVLRQEISDLQRVRLRGKGMKRYGGLIAKLWFLLRFRGYFSIDKTSHCKILKLGDLCL